MQTVDEYDLIVLGSGAAGLAAALAGHEHGLNTLVLEKSAKLGGGTTNSYGLLWFGRNHLAANAGYSDSREETLEYMRFLAGGEAITANLDAFVDRSPDALRFFLSCGVPFRIAKGVRDHYFGVAPGAKEEGRSLEVDLVSGYDLGQWRDRVRMSSVQPCYITAEEQIKWGGVNRAAQWDSELVRTRQDADMRGKGVGLVCQLLKCLLARGVQVETSCVADQLLREGDRVTGIIAGDRRILARQGVLLATGGYESNDALVRAYEGLPDWMSQVPSSVTGDGLVLGMEAGGAVHTLRNNMQLFLGFGIPVEEGQEPEFHLAGIVELCSPHTMVVNATGARFADEAYFQGMIPSLRYFDVLRHAYPNLPCFLVFDQQYASRYSFAGQPAGQIPQWVARADDLPSLAAKLGIDPDGLSTTASRFNAHARTGADPDFRRGELAWRLAHDSDMPAGLNQSLGTIEQPPFYGIALRPSGASSAGLLTNADAQVLSSRGLPVKGLYATGNTAARTELGAGYQAGYTLASNLTFGYLAARHMAAQQAS